MHDTSEINKLELRFKEEFLVTNNSKFRLFLGSISFRSVKLAIIAELYVFDKSR